MPATGKLLIVDNVIAPGNTPDGAKVSDVMMMTHLGGMERTEAEFRALLQATGFELDKVVPAAVRGIMAATPAS